MRVEAQGPSLFVMNTDSPFVQDENIVASTSTVSCSSTVSRSFDKISFLHINIRGWRSHYVELEATLQLMTEKPHVICVNETFLDRGCKADLYGYKLVGRRDRPCGTPDSQTDTLQAWGGVLVFVLAELDGSIVLVHTSDVAERMWFVLHTDVGPVLLCAIYRPPSRGNIEVISTLFSELPALRADVVGTIVIGDFNCHNARWLKYSNGMSTEGTALERFSMDHGLQQIVREPTRGNYLLDLVLTDMSDAASVRILPAIADHSVVLTSFKFSLDTVSCPPRTVWCYRSADWQGLNNYLNQLDYSFMHHGDVDTVTNNFTQTLLDSAKMFIKQKTLSCSASAHPWMSDRCREALAKKHSSVGTPESEYRAACEACSAVLHEEFQLYVSQLKVRMSKMKRGSKE